MHFLTPNDQHHRARQKTRWSEQVRPALRCMRKLGADARSFTIVIYRSIGEAFVDLDDWKEKIVQDVIYRVVGVEIGFLQEPSELSIFGLNVALKHPSDDEI